MILLDFFITKRIRVISLALAIFFLIEANDKKALESQIDILEVSNNKGSKIVKEKYNDEDIIEKRFYSFGIY